MILGIITNLWFDSDFRLFASTLMMKNLFVKGLTLVANIAGVTALTPAEWRSQTIYQVLTDRFSLENGSTSACDNLNDYCGGLAS